MWDVKTAKALTTPITTQGDSIGALAFSPNGKYFASGSGDGTIALWDATTRRPIGIRLYGHTGSVNSLAFSPNNTLLVSGGSDKTVRLWDVSRQIALSEPLVGHPGEISNVAFTKDGMQLIASGNDGYILQWNVEQSDSISQTIRYVSQERAIDGSPESSGLNCLTASPSGKFLAACGDDGTILFWNIVNRHIGIQQYIKLSHLTPSDHTIVTTLIFSRDNQFLLACDSNQCWLIDRATKRQLWYNAPDTYTPGESSIAVGNLVLSPDGNTFALSTSSSDPESTVTNHFIEARDMKTGKILHLLHDGPKTKATNDPLSLTDPDESPDESYRIAWSPDGQLLVSEDMQGNIHLWDPRSGNNRGQMRRDIPIPASMSIHSAVSFRPDGKILLSNSTNGQITVWDMKTKKSVAQSFTSHVPGQPINNDQQIKSFTGIAWSPDGTTIAAVGSSQENVQTQYGISYGHDIVVWNATNSEPLLHPIHYEDGIFPQSLLFLPENMSLAVATFQELDGADLPSSNTITVWNLDSNTWIEEACILANRNLTPVEWKQFLPAESNYQKICPDLP
jgi:WD40 repeat protein